LTRASVNTRGEYRRAHARIPAGHGLDAFFCTPEGDFIGYDVARQRYGDPETGYINTDSLTPYVRFVPIAILPQVAARYQLMHLVLAMTAMTLGFAVVERRVP
jgi:hypothetical protein